MNQYWDWALSNSAPTCTHPHPPPHTTHPIYLSTNPHPPTLTQNNVTLTTKGVPFIQYGMPIFQPCLPKGIPIFQLFLKKIFQLCLVFANFKNILESLENLSRETKNWSFNICKILLRKNLVNLKSLMSFLLEHVELTEQLFG